MLGVEASFDDSAAAIVNCRGQILANEKLSHRNSPENRVENIDPRISLEMHKKNLPLVLDKVTQGMDVDKLRAIAVSIGPG